MSVKLLGGKVLHTRQTLKSNKYNKYLESEINTTITNNQHNLLNEVGSEIKVMGRFS